MGSFQITYDDFTGGHYMGDRSASLPNNTWRGRNALLSPNGDLIPSGAKKLRAIDAPSVSGLISTTKIHDAISTHVTGLVLPGSMFFVTYYWFSPTPGTASRRHDVTTDGLLNNLNTWTLTGRLEGKVTYDNYRTGVNPPYAFTYIDYTTGNIRQITNSGTDTLVVANPFPSGYKPYSLYKVGYRLVTHDARLLFYSAALDASSWSATDYYEFPDTILNVYARTNDFLVMTSSGLFSVTGVLGENVTIQPIVPAEQTVNGMARAVLDGRSLVFSDEGYLHPYGTSKTSYMDSTLYELVGSEVYPIATLDQSDLLDDIMEVGAGLSGESIVVENVGGNQLACLSRDGVAWFKNRRQTWARMYPADWAPVSMDTDSNQIAICRPISGPESSSPPRNFRQPKDEYSVAAIVDFDTLQINVLRYINNHPYTNANDFIFSGSIGATELASATVDLAEYWHSKPMVVRELVVETVFDNPADLNLATSTTSTLAPTVYATGSIDRAPTATPQSSSAQSISVALSTITGIGQRAIYRFKVDDAGRAYGFYPSITWQGCRIRRVIAICED